MFSKSAITSVLILSLALQTSAHALIAPMLGVNGRPSRNDVQRPSQSKPCGNIDIASTINSSKLVEAGRNGDFNVTVTNFNAGRDGSRHVTLKIDSTGKGQEFVTGTIIKNGDLVPTSSSNQSVVAALPAGTKCSGGATKNLCLASFTTASGFGNCVVVKQVNTTAESIAPALPPSESQSSALPTTSQQEADGEGDRRNDRIGLAGHTSCQNNQQAEAGHNMSEVGEIKNDQPSVMGRAVGTRAPRAIRRMLVSGAREMKTDMTERGIMDWVWA